MRAHHRRRRWCRRPRPGSIADRDGHAGLGREPPGIGDDRSERIDPGVVPIGACTTKRFDSFTTHDGAPVIEVMVSISASVARSVTGMITWTPRVASNDRGDADRLLVDVDGDLAARTKAARVDDCVADDHVAVLTLRRCVHAAHVSGWSDDVDDRAVGAERSQIHGDRLAVPGLEESVVWRPASTRCRA